MGMFGLKPKATQQRMTAPLTTLTTGDARQIPERRFTQNPPRASGDNAPAEQAEQAQVEFSGVNSHPAAMTGFGHDFSRIPIRASSPLGVQTKLTINTPGDLHEQEANRVSDEVVRRQKAERADAGEPRADRSVALSKARVEPSDKEQITAPPLMHEVLRSSGQPLDHTTRAAIEPRLGHDFSAIRIHTSPAAEQSAQEMNARAYTVGHHLVFGAEQFAPGTHEGQRLLAHELTHVAQQNGERAAVQRTPAPNTKENENVATARQRGKALADRINKEGKLSEAAKAKMIDDLKLFEGAAWDAYNEAIRPTLKAITEIDMSEPEKTPYWLREASPGLAELADAFTDTFLPGVTLEDAREAVHVINAGNQAGMLREARALFRARHDGHSETVLNNIDTALERVTKNNPDLLIAYYRYYADHELTDDLPWNMSEDDYAGATSGGDTDINPKVLTETSAFPTESGVSLLGETLIHEYSHTPQDNPNDDQFEAKALGIEYWFAERAGDQKRVTVISKQGFGYGIDIRRILYRSYYTMKDLYERIDKGGPDAVEARQMSVEYISKNKESYRPELKSIYTKVSEYYVP